MYLLFMFPPVITFCKTMVKYHSQSISIYTDNM